ncbi:MAG: DUF4339 domain-containing protein [Bdellovibrionota bacterium]
MDGFNEKKWFVYLGDHHEGPFSLEDIQSKMGEGAVSTGTYVWADGMPDWKLMTEVQAFDALMNGHSNGHGNGNGHSEPTMVIAPMILESQPTDAVSPSAENALPADEKTGELDARELKQAKGGRKPISPAVKWAALATVPLVIVGLALQGTLDPVLKNPAVNAGLQALSEALRPQLIKLTEKVPALAKWISPIPTLEDVLPEEFDGLRSAAVTPLDAGPKVALALSRGDLGSPSFYIASNLPDMTMFDVYVEGVSESLLNQTAFSGHVKATVTKRLGKTEAIRYADGKLLARGDYMIYVVLPEQANPAIKALSERLPPMSANLPASLPRDARVVALHTYFLGGNKDNTYALRLKEYHDKLRERSAQELGEVKQFSGTLESQLRSTIAKFQSLKHGNKPTSAGRKAWGKFHDEWMQLQSQMDQVFLKWTPESLQKDYFYGVLYQLTLQTAQGIEKVHGFQHSYFTGALDPKAFEIQLGEAVSNAQGAVSLLKAKIEQAEKIPPTPNGMPRKEGL